MRKILLALVFSVWISPNLSAATIVNYKDLTDICKTLGGCNQYSKNYLKNKFLIANNRNAFFAVDKNRMFSRPAWSAWYSASTAKRSCQKRAKECVVIIAKGKIIDKNFERKFLQIKKGNIIGENKTSIERNFVPAPKSNIKIDQEKMIYGNIDDYGGNDAIEKIPENQAHFLKIIKERELEKAISDALNQTVCLRATKLDGSDWESLDSKFYIYVKEAQRRNISLATCNIITERGNSKTLTTKLAQTPTSKVDKEEKKLATYKKIPNITFCSGKNFTNYPYPINMEHLISSFETDNSPARNCDQITQITFCDYYKNKKNHFYKINYCETETALNEETKKQLAQTPISKVDKDAPILKIQDRIRVTDRSYSITGTVSDASDVFIEVDGIAVPVKNNKFTLKGSSSIGFKEYKIVAFDQWGNETRKSIMVERVIQTVSNDNSFEPLKPETLETKRNKNRIALIIGMEEYENMSSANYAQRDAELFIDYVQGAFGVPQSNIKHYINADTKIKFDIKSWLKKNVRKNTEVYVYFSGHGMATNNGTDLYLLTHDTIAEYIEETAFNRNEIFNDIAQYNPKSVIAFLDTCYSGAGRADGEMLLAMAKGLVVVDENQQQLPDNFTLFTAASAQESAWSLPEAKHGTFSYFLMKGMEGEADLNGDKKLTNGELQEYLLDNVGRYAQQQQTPQMIGNPNQVLVRF